jgi:hypothetical protein
LRMPEVAYAMAPAPKRGCQKGYSRLPVRRYSPAGPKRQLG